MLPAASARRARLAAALVEARISLRFPALDFEWRPF